MNISKLKLQIESKKGGLTAMLKSTGIPKGSYYKSLEIGWFTTERLGNICSYLGIHPGDLYDYEPEETPIAQAAEPMPAYSTKGKTNEEILQDLAKIIQKYDKK